MQAGSEAVTYTFPGGHEGEFRMFDLDGRLVVKQSVPNTNGVEEVAVQHLPKGL